MLASSSSSTSSRWNGLDQGAADASGDLDGLVLVLDAGQVDRELVAAEPGHDVDVAQRRS